MNKFCFVFVDRANFRMIPLVYELDKFDTEISIVCCGTLPLARFHKPSDYLHGFTNATYHTIYHEVEGSNKLSMMHSMASLMSQFANKLDEINPDCVVVIGDRYETLVIAQVTNLMGYCLVHLQGGEESGNIDEYIRHAITKLAHYHVPSTSKAANVLVNVLGENQEAILDVGCPSVDFVNETVIGQIYLCTAICMYHPEEDVDNASVVWKLLCTLEKLKLHVYMFWSNIDPNSEQISKMIRRYISLYNPLWLEMVVNWQPVTFYTMLATVLCGIGNSSSFARDASFFGTPVLLIGNRQRNREIGDNVKRLADVSEIPNYLEWCRQYERKANTNYGTKGISEKIAKKLLKLKSRKSLTKTLNTSSLIT